MSEPIDPVVLGQSRVVTQYATKPDFMAYIAALLAAPAQIETAGQAVLASLDIDLATGAQLDRIGEIVGQSRYIPEAYPSPFFGFHDTPEGEVYGDGRTNLILYSNTFANAAWIKSRLASVTPGALAGGTTSGFLTKFVEDATIGGHGAYQLYTKPQAVAMTRTFSVVAKAAERNIIQLLQEGSTSGSASATFNLATGLTSGIAVSGGFSAASATMTPTGGGEYLCQLTATSNTNAGIYATIYLKNGAGVTSYLGDGTSGAYFADAQFEARAPASERIATTSAPVTVVDENPYDGPFYELDADRTTTWNLDDATYRGFLRARILRNKSTGTHEDFISILQLIFPSDGIIVRDVDGELQIAIGLDRETTLSELVTLNYTGILPKPAGVALIVLPYTLLLTYFGFNPTDLPYGDTVTGGGGPFIEVTY